MAQPRKYGIYVSTSRASPFSRTKVPRALRFIFLGLLIRRWRLWATFALILPVAVRLKRFFAPLLVFILGISVLSKGYGLGRRGMPRAPEGAANRPMRRGL